MTQTVTVALLAHPRNPHEAMVPAEVWRLPWSERRKVELRCEDDETLSSILARAYDEFELPSPTNEMSDPDFAHGYIMFFQPNDVDGVNDHHERLTHQLTLVDQRGLAVFGVYDWRTITLGQLIESGRAGVLEGDPLRPYLLVEPPWGDSGPIDWPTFREALSLAWSAIEAVGIAGSAWYAVDMVRGKLLNGRQVLADRWTDWSQRSREPLQFSSLFSNRRWKTSEVSILLDCSEAEAASILELFGFEEDEFGFWVRGEGAEHRFMRALLTLAERSHSSDHETWRKLYTKQLEAYLRDGDPPESD